MSQLETFTVGAERYRLGAWRGAAGIGYLVPLTPPERISRVGVQRSLDRLSQQGFREVLTSALTSHERQIFERWGFTLFEDLHLLHHDLHPVPAWPLHHHPVRLRPGHRWHRRAVLEVDHQAFDELWQLDLSSLVEAMTATPLHRFRVAWAAAPATAPRGQPTPSRRVRHQRRHR